MLKYVTYITYQLAGVHKEDGQRRYSTDMRRLTTGIRSEKCVVWRFRHARV